MTVRNLARRLLLVARASLSLAVVASCATASAAGPGNVGAATATAVEYYWTARDHFFFSTNPAEIAALDASAPGGWTRTGYQFGAYVAAAPGSTPVCRFYIPPAYGDSHFYSASPAECAAVAARFPMFVYEAPNVTNLILPDLATGACPAGSDPVYRLFDNRVDTNHRYTTSLAVRATMIQRGYVPEGYGPDGVAACAPQGGPTLIPSADGLTVYDTILHVHWLADANAAAGSIGNLGVAGVTPGGSMTYGAAAQWIAALNALDAGAGYLGHNNWTLPVTPTTDATCSAIGPQGNSFGFGCRNSALGSLYYRGLGFAYPDTAVPIPGNAVGPFRNFQPYLYWYDTASGMNANGYDTFSFATGWSGSNVDGHVMYALPMIPGRAPATYHAAGSGSLEVSADGQLVYDPIADATWLADADLAASQTFGAQCVNADATPCIDRDGAMSHSTARNWVAGMNAYNGGAGWLGLTHWQLPPVDVTAPCSASACTGKPLYALFYKELGLGEGIPVAPTPDVATGPFRHLQPYLYWACTAPDCSTPPAPGFGWSFSFGNGFQGTDVVGNRLYVTAYYPEPVTDALAAAIATAVPVGGERDDLLALEADIAGAPDPGTRANHLKAFVDHVNADIGTTLGATQAAELVALARAL